MKKLFAKLSFLLFFTGCAFGAYQNVTINPVVGATQGNLNGNITTLGIPSGYLLISRVGSTVDLRLGTIMLPALTGVGTVTSVGLTSGSTGVVITGTPVTSFGTINLNLPQNIDTTASPTFAGLTITKSAAADFADVSFINTGALGYARIKLTAQSNTAQIYYQPGAAFEILTPDNTPIIFAVNNGNVGSITSSGLNGMAIGSTTRAVGNFTAISATGQITSTLAGGTAPFVVTSTTVVTNLNAGLLNGTTWTAPGSIGTGTPGVGRFSTLSGTSLGVGVTSPSYIVDINGNAPFARILDTAGGGGAVLLGSNNINTAGSSILTASGFLFFGAENVGIGYMSSTGLNGMTIGASAAAVGTFTTVNATSVVINKATASNPAPLAGTLLHLTNVDTIGAGVQADGFAAGSNWIARRAGGTSASPSAVQNNDLFGGFIARGYGTTGYVSANSAAIFAKASQTWTDTAAGTRWEFYTTPNASITSTLVVTFKDSGIVNIVTTPNYANNAAAIGGGLVAGDVYRNGDVMQIVH